MVRDPLHRPINSTEELYQNEDFKRALLDTGDRVIVEASPSDESCGIGFTSQEMKGRDSEWGENKLDKALMNSREKLRQGF